MIELSDIFDKLERSTYAGHAQYIGHLCITWGWLEGSVDAMLHVLVGTGDFRISAILAYNMDLRDKLAAIRALGYLKKPSDEWYGKLERLVNEIDNDLRPERNRMVHDYWLSLGDEIFRFTNQTKIVREQARKLKLTYGTGRPIPKSNLMVAVVKTLAACAHMLTLVSTHQNVPRSTPDKG